jgi:hypothetical protein
MSTHGPPFPRPASPGHPLPGQATARLPPLSARTPPAVHATTLLTSICGFQATQHGTGSATTLLEMCFAGARESSDAPCSTEATLPAGNASGKPSADSDLPQRPRTTLPPGVRIEAV